MKDVSIETGVVRFTFTAAVITIILGGVIYLGCRPTSLYIFKWTGIDETTPWLSVLRGTMSGALPYWTIYEMPAALWSMSYVLFILGVWKFNLRESLPYLSIIPLMGIISELLQIPGIVPGRFDIIDLAAYFIGSALGIALPYAFKFLYINIITRKISTL